MGEFSRRNHSKIGWGIDKQTHGRISLRGVSLILPTLLSLIHMQQERKHQTQGLYVESIQWDLHTRKLHTLEEKTVASYEQAAVKKPPITHTKWEKKTTQTVILVSKLAIIWKRKTAPRTCTTKTVASAY
jgi:hypothetical protein